MIIDCHLHLSGHSVPADYLRDAERYGVDCVSGLGKWNYEPPHEDCVETNRDVLHEMKRYPWLVLGFCYVNPRHREAVDELRWCIEHGMVGLKLWTGTFCDEPCVYPVIEAAIELELPVMIHTFHKVVSPIRYESKPMNVVNLARRYPEAKLIMAHWGGEWRSGVRAAEICPSITIDTSGSILETEMTETGVARLGPERLVFGSDNSDLLAMLSKVYDARISDRAKQMILGENMARLLSPLTIVEQPTALEFQGRLINRLIVMQRRP
jgi:uncharacterized protein